MMSDRSMRQASPVLWSNSSTACHCTMMPVSEPDSLLAESISVID